jgi:amphi-Trp domain-containing protein
LHFHKRDRREKGLTCRLGRRRRAVVLARRQPKGNLMKKQKFKFSEQQALDTCIRQLEGLLEGLKSGTLTLSQGDEKLWLRPGGAVDVELRAEQSGERESLEIQLVWQRASLHVISRKPDDAPPQTVRGWQQNGQIAAG